MAYRWLIGIRIVDYQPDFSSMPSSFSLNRPRAVVVTLSKSFIQLSLPTADEVVVRDCVAVPNSNIQFSQPFNEGECEFLLESRVFASICAGSSAEFGATVFEANIGILP